jgi:hypothetical protein
MDKKTFFQNQKFKKKLEENFQIFQKKYLRDLKNSNIKININYNLFELKSDFTTLKISFDGFFPIKRENFNYNTVKIEYYINCGNQNIYENNQEIENIMDIAIWVWNHNQVSLAYKLFSLEKDTWYNINKINLNEI